MSASLSRKLVLPVVYLSDNTIGETEGREKSDHMLLRLPVAKPAAQPGTRTTRFVVQPLREGDTANYHAVLTRTALLTASWTGGVLY